MPKLTLTMIVKNEEKYLEECLASVKDIVDEFVIVDTGSTDKTVEIARKYEAQIYEFKWINDFSAARNFALSKSTGNWILYLDADERISPESLKELERIKNLNENSGYFCTVKSIDNENNRDNSMRYVRLFRNSAGISFAGKVHEQITGSLISKGVKLLNSKILIIHLGYNIPVDEKKEKANRNLKLLLEEYEKNKSGYYSYQLANTYLILEDNINSARYFKIAIESGGDLSKILKAECYTNMALFAHKEFDSESSLEFINKALNLNSDQPFSFLLASKIYLQKGNKQKAEELCKTAILVNKKQLNGNNNNELQIYLDIEEVSCYGLLLAVQNNNRENFGYYLKEYKCFLKKVNSQISDQLEKVITKLLSVQQLSAEEENAFLSLINKNSSELFFSLLENAISVQRENFLQNLTEKYKEDKNIIRLCSKYYFDNNNIEEAINILVLNRKVVEEDPSSILYLISYYLTLGRFDKAEEWINVIELKFKHMTQITLIAANIKEKILLLKNS